MIRHATPRLGTGSLAPPPGLDRMRPREVRPTASGWALLVLSAAVIVGGLAGGVGLQLKALHDADAVRGFRDRARETAGVVTRKWRARGEGRPRWVAYDFTVNGRVFRGETKPARSVWEGIDVGSPVPVRFEPDRPERHFTWGRLPGAVPPVVPYLVGAAGLGSGALLTIPFLRQRRLLTEGRAARATVTTKTTGEHGMIHYEFKVLSGGHATGQTGTTKKAPDVGRTMWVIYASDDPRWNSPYPFLLVRLLHAGPLTPSRQIVERAHMAPHQGNP